MNQLTEPQLRALKEIAAGRVIDDGERFRSTEYPPAVRHDVISRVVARGFAELGGHVMRVTTGGNIEHARKVFPTDYGREVLANV